MLKLLSPHGVMRGSSDGRKPPEREAEMEQEGKGSLRVLLL